MRFVSPYSYVLIHVMCFHISVSLFLNNCPDKMMWNLRGKNLCGTIDQYMCLYDTNERKFRELCKEEPEFHRPGNIFIISGNLRYFAGRPCKSSKYQPHKWWTNGSSECQYLKSTCNEDGQVPYDNGTISRDRKCRCDYTNYYAYNNGTKNKCHCDPTEEDCSCYKKRCREDEVLTPDYECVNIHAWTGRFVCPEYKPLRNTDKKEMQTLCPNIEKDLYGTIKRTRVPIAYTGIFAFIVVVGVMTIVFAKQRAIMKEETQLIEDKIPDLLKKEVENYIREFIPEYQEQMMEEQNEQHIPPHIREYQEQMMEEQNEQHIPPHIRAHHGQEIREWEQDQTTFLETRATRHILESLLSHNCIVVTGSPGCGKSSNIHQAALHLRDSLEYEIIPVLTGPTDIMNYYNQNEKQVFIVDDICGKETINMQTLHTWIDYSEKIEKILKVAEKDVASKNDKTVSKVSSTKLLLSCRLHIYKEAQFQRITLFTKKECNLSSPELCLLEAERMHMLHKYLPDDIIDNIKQVIENVDYFPLLCKLSKDKTSEEVKKLFTAPLISIKQHIINIIYDNKEQFCALVLCIVFNDGFDTDWLKLGSVSERKNMKTDKLENIVIEFDINLSKEKQRNSLKAGFSTLNGTYLKLIGTEYRMIHDKIYTMAAVICGQHLTKCFIKYAPAIFIRDNFIFESVTEVLEKDDLIVLSKDEELDYFERLLCDLTKHVILSTFRNYQLIYQTFRDKLINFLKSSDEAKTVFERFEKQNLTTTLIESASYGYLEIVHFLIVNVKCNVNKTDALGSSPLYKASKRGHLDVVKLLLKKNADVTQCNNDGESSLYVACKRGHSDIVELLLQNNADVSHCNRHGESPLYMACKNGHTDIAQLLLQSNADVSQHEHLNGQSPLHAACDIGYLRNIETVKLLLEWNADPKLCNKRGQTPLDIARKSQSMEIVNILEEHLIKASQLK